MPSVELPPATPFTDQSTVALLVVILVELGVACETGSKAVCCIDPGDSIGAADAALAGTFAVNCWVPPTRTFADDGLTVIPDLPLKAHPARNNVANRRAKPRMDVGKDFLDIRFIVRVIEVRIIESLTESCGMSDRANAE